MRKTNIALSTLLLTSALIWTGSASALNPQPEPPAERNKHLQMQNMQFQPPDPCMAAQTAKMDKHLSESARTSQLNAAALACSHRGPGNNQLNPQPLPPG